MLDNNPDAVKRYAPPPQRNRSLNRRKSGEKFEKINFPYGVDGEKSQASYSRNFPPIDHVEAGSNSIQSEHSRAALIPLDGCCTSEAAQLLNSRWAAAMRLYNEPSADLSEKPIMYSVASGSSWGHLKLPHQMDFLGELRRAMQNAHTSAMPTSGDHS